jgi:hypothetical protein
MDKEDSISIVKLISLIPEKEIDNLARRTKVNHYVKVLDGKSVLYLILYALIECQRNSLRTMEDIFNSTKFKFLFNLQEDKTVKYNSISERLSVINIEFFKKAYDLIYKSYSQYFKDSEIREHKLIRVDSTMVAETANKLQQGLIVGKKKKGKNKNDRKLLKYTIAYDGILPVAGKIFTGQEYLSEDKTIPNIVFDYAKKDKESIFVFDRGVQKREVFVQLNQDKTAFVCRLNPGARTKIVEEMEQGQNRPVGTLELISDQKIQLGIPCKRIYYDEYFRLITAYDSQSKTYYYFLTNIFDAGVEDILAMYKSRWDIEVFFRFLKQELNFSHIFSTSENGIQVMLYMTMISSMLVLIYKHLNKVGYKTAVRRISFELDELIIKLIVKHCGGDPSLVFR